LQSGCKLLAAAAGRLAPATGAIRCEVLQPLRWLAVADSRDAFLPVVWHLLYNAPSTEKRCPLSAENMASARQTASAGTAAVNAVGIVLAVLFLLVRRQFLEGRACEV
jgi:hypothetical protein